MKEDRTIHQDDINAAARGLALIGKSPSELEDLMLKHPINAVNWASRVIHLAAKQILQVKRMNGAR